MNRGKHVSGIVIGWMGALLFSALAYTSYMDGRPVKVTGRYGWQPHEVSASRYASLATVLAIVSLFVAVMTTLAFVKQRRIDQMSKQIMKGLCPYCGYALGDTTGTATCPECGKRNALPVKRVKSQD